MIGSRVPGERTVIDGPREDVTWALLDVLRRHRYEDRQRTETKPDDPGWHACSCGAWEGYWCDWQPHVAEELAAITACTEHGRYGCASLKHPAPGRPGRG